VTDAFLENIEGRRLGKKERKKETYRSERKKKETYRSERKKERHLLPLFANDRSALEDLQHVRVKT
jgi:hypothetical protein